MLLPSLLAWHLACAAPVTPLAPPPSTVGASALPADAVIAFVMVDRFADGSANLPDVDATHVRRFQGGDLRGLRERLPWLKRLGVSHLWVTPLARQIDGLVGDGVDATAAYHGYWPSDLRGIDPHFGSDDDLHALVRAAHDHDIGVIVDVVTNHLGYGAQDPDRLVRARCGETDIDRCLFGLPDLDTSNARVRDVVVERTLRWVRDFNVDGFRFDAFRHAEPELFRAIRLQAQALRPGFFTLAERWGASPLDDDAAAIVREGAADAVLDFSLMGLARDWVQGRMRTAAFAHHLLQRDRALASGAPMVAFLDSHDVETWAHAVGARASLGAPLLLLDRAVPVLTWGTELGRAGGAGDPENRAFMPWSIADAAEQDPRAPLHLWRALVALRRRWPVAHAGTLTLVARDDDERRESATPAHPRPHGFVVLQRDDGDTRVVFAMARGSALHHVQSIDDGTSIVDLVAHTDGRAQVVDGRLVVDVPADGSVVVVLRAARSDGTRALVSPGAKP